MRFRTALTVVALLSSVPLIAACNGSSQSGFELAPPVNYQPSAGLSPDLSIAGLSTPSAPPFRP